MSWLRPCAQWCAKLAYLADIFKHLNELNSKKQGKEENLLSSSDKLRGFKSKFTLCRSCVKQVQVQVFVDVICFLCTVNIQKAKNNPTLSLSICKPLTRDLITIFPAETFAGFDWVRDPWIRALWRAQPTCHCRHRSNWQRWEKIVH